VIIEGHTDEVGSDESNMVLSQSRADSVMNYMVAQGIDKYRLAAKGYGETKPIAPNDTDAGRAQNRRVQLSVAK
jgi:outer membrane protein OmpA-like peptidoglycan-associated protein